MFIELRVGLVDKQTLAGGNEVEQSQPERSQVSFFSLAEHG